MFIGKNTSTGIGKWIHAEFIPTKGFSSRGGWHVGLIPDAPWLKSYNYTNIGCYNSRRSKYWKRVWVELKFNATNNYDKDVELMPKKCFVDKIPENGYYSFRETGCDRIWIITSDIKINKILTEDERQDILKEVGYNEAEAYAKYKKSMEKRMKIKS